MTADLLTAKIRRGFDHLDADGDGRLDEKDHILMGERTAQALGYPPGSPAEQRMVDKYVRIWREAHLPNVPEGETAISRDRFVAAMRRAVDLDPSTAQAALGAIAEAFVELADLNADGRITPREFLLFHRGHFPGITEADAAIAFAHLDLDGDGSLSPAEFVRATVEYWTSSDPKSPSNWWLGPPPDVS